MMIERLTVKGPAVRRLARHLAALVRDIEARNIAECAICRASFGDYNDASRYVHRVGCVALAARLELDRWPARWRRP